MSDFERDSVIGVPIRPDLRHCSGHFRRIRGLTVIPLYIYHICFKYIIYTLLLVAAAYRPTDRKSINSPSPVSFHFPSAADPQRKSQCRRPRERRDWRSRRTRPPWPRPCKRRWTGERRPRGPRASPSTWPCRHPRNRRICRTRGTVNPPHSGGESSGAGNNAEYSKSFSFPSLSLTRGRIRKHALIPPSFSFSASFNRRSMLLDIIPLIRLRFFSIIFVWMNKTVGVHLLDSVDKVDKVDNLLFKNGIMIEVGTKVSIINNYE